MGWRFWHRHQKQKHQTEPEHIGKWRGTECRSAASWLSAALSLQSSQPKWDVTHIYSHDRFPNIVSTPSGAVLLVFGMKEVKIRRSDDGGASWGAVRMSESVRLNAREAEWFCFNACWEVMCSCTLDV